MQHWRQLPSPDSDFKRGERQVELLFNGSVASSPSAPNPTMFPIADEGPYYAALLTGGNLDTKGGPKTPADGLDYARACAHARAKSLENFLPMELNPIARSRRTAPQYSSGNGPSKRKPDCWRITGTIAVAAQANLQEGIYYGSPVIGGQ